MNDKRDWRKCTRIDEFPAVLILLLSRWTDPTSPSLHTVRADRVLKFQDQTYELIATVCHLGGSAHAGHYVTVAKHRGHWFVYDDHNCKAATENEISTDFFNFGWGNMQSYILFYEKTV